MSLVAQIRDYAEPLYQSLTLLRETYAGLIPYTLVYTNTYPKIHIAY